MDVQTIDLNKLINLKHREFFRSRASEIVFYGGAGSAKTFSVTDKLLLQILQQEKPLKIIVLRRSFPSAKRSNWDIWQQRAQVFGLHHVVHAVDQMIEFPDFGARVLFLSCNNSHEVEKLKSITDVDFLHCEEATDVIEGAYDQALLRMRGGVSSWKQAIVTFNPVSRISWVYSRYFEKPTEAQILHTTWRDNPWLSADFIKRLEDLKKQDPYQYNVYNLGLWGSAKGRIYTWERVDAIPEDAGIYARFGGIDWGFNHPTAAVLLHIGTSAVYVQQILYGSGYITKEIIEKIKPHFGTTLIAADSSEQDRIEEALRAGLKVVNANKEVEPGIRFVQSLNVKVLSPGDDVMKEQEAYSWALDHNDKPLDQPVKGSDHAMDAVRYGLYTNRHHIRKGPSIKPDDDLVVQYSLAQRLRRRPQEFDPMTL